MQPTAADYEDLFRPATDVSPEPTPDTAVHDLFELWQDLGGSD